MLYRVVKSENTSEDGVRYISYGIELLDGEKVVRSAYDMDTEPSGVEKLCALCNVLSLSPLHFWDVIEDYLAK